MTPYNIYKNLFSYHSGQNIHFPVSFLYEKIKITLSLWLTYSLVEF